MAEELHRASPSLPVVFTSGHATDVVIRHGVLADGTPFLQKPFSLATLTKKIQELLSDAR